MKPTVTFTHLVTGKQITIARNNQNNQFPITTILHGPAKDPKTGRESPEEHVWIVIENVPNPLPIRETYEEAMSLLEFNNKE